MENKKTALLILDGWGKGCSDHSNAIFSAKTNYFDSLVEQWPTSQLRTDGLFVGLPEGQMGNSEVGHLNIGAGRVVFQDLVRINQSIDKNTLINNKAIQSILSALKQNPEKNLHLFGLVSDGGIHSHINHLLALVDIFKTVSNQVYIHAFTDGRDTDPKSGLGHIKNLEQYINEYSHVNISSIIGRYYAMDRDNRWERISEAYELLTAGKGNISQNVIQSIEDSYNNNVTDEFIKPIKLKNEDYGIIRDNDLVLSFNYRTDRCREISIALTQKDFPEFNMRALNLEYYTMTKYDANFKNVNIVFDKDNLKNTLGEVLASNGKTQLRTAETEKYPHVTFFFSGGRESLFDGETRILASSPKVATYDLRPEMSAQEIKSKTIDHVRSNEASDFICLNFANPDMVGHTGVFSAVQTAIETVDNCLKELVPVLTDEGYQIIIIADHGNAEMMVNSDGSCHTAHTTNPVPCILLNSCHKEIKDGKLADIAPTILRLMNLEQPIEMNGVPLI
ncbi:MAG: 2,3-bisphosphoglycerate-independent phosphoglycerate mutase [Flavobacteriales bacterium]